MVPRFPRTYNHIHFPSKINKTRYQDGNFLHLILTLAPQLSSWHHTGGTHSEGNRFSRSLIMQRKSISNLKTSLHLLSLGNFLKSDYSIFLKWFSALTITNCGSFKISSDGIHNFPREWRWIETNPTIRKNREKSEIIKPLWTWEDYPREVEKEELTDAKDRLLVAKEELVDAKALVNAKEEPWKLWDAAIIKTLSKTYFLYSDVSRGRLNDVVRQPYVPFNRYVQAKLSLFITPCQNTFK